jgi:hypothetical protein
LWRRVWERRFRSGPGSAEHCAASSMLIRKLTWWPWHALMRPRGANAGDDAQLLAEKKLVEVGLVEEICDETVRRTLKKGVSNPG